MATVLEVRQALVDRGYVPIPVMGKMPPFKRWQKVENVSRPMLEAWGRNWPRASNTGILTKFTPTLDTDILNEPAAIAIEELSRERFEERGYILPRIGRPPKRAIPFRTLDPFAKITVNLIAADGSTRRENRVPVRRPASRRRRHSSRHGKPYALAARRSDRHRA